MIDISIVSRKAKERDLYAPLELSNEGPPKLAGTALLSDSQSTFIGDFITKYLPRSQHAAFRKSVLSRLSDGKPGDGAFRQAMRLTAMDGFGFDTTKLSSCGLSFMPDRAYRVDTSPRKQRPRIRRGKHG